MADKKWMADRFKQFKVGREEQDAMNEAFSSLLPKWIETFKTDIRELIAELNEQLTKDGRMHVVQVNDTGRGCELMAAQLPFFQINIDREHRCVTFGFENLPHQKLNLALRGDGIICENPDGTASDDCARSVLADYADRAMRDIT